MIDNRDMFMGYTYPYMDNNNINMRISILERNIKRLEDRIAKLEGTYNTEGYMNNAYNNNYPNNMYNMI